ncbi:multidrug ABC transporter ATP-binding protein [Bacillus canaveralius]|uniref:Multidrug ABC transporter ATP-binding protein n=1 Tax=Bacillus canaveralius TaxID=1403243 RepID=A0A2N5GSW1_9BACI|nr:ABC transporter ATP-binding protein [Bacillus canaveralius]PLR86856.1 multidrug ABC transporter ATP-binding protein [Bacillus canaveralius]PLR93344.1 multidrug ABC transporter ATP-binding protein [Bacillus canaveralius]
MFKELTKPFQYKRVSVLARDEISEKKKVIAKNGFATVKRIWQYFASCKRLFIFVLFMVVASSALGLLGPFLIGMTIDEYVVSGDSSNLILRLIELAVVYLLYSASILFQNFWMIGIAQNTVFTMRTQLFSHLHKLPIPFFDKRQHGELMSRVTNDIENVSTTLNSSVIQIFSSVLTLTGTVTVMLWLSPLLTLVTLIIVPLMFMGMKWITNRTGKLFKEQQHNLGNLNGFIEETISGQRIVKTFSQEKKAISEFRTKNAKLKEAGFWAQTYSGFIPKLMNFLNNFSFAIIAGIGGLLALRGIVTIGVIVIFAEYARQFTRPLNDLANQFNTMLSAVAGAERVFAILDEKEEMQDERFAADLPAVKGEVEFRNVSFSYEKEDTTVTDIDFYAAQGQTVAFVGPTGAGKTTLINLISRFYDPDSGKILIDGHDITSIKRESLRRHMAFVLQDSFLFEGTIKENIRYGRLDASDSEVEEAARKANAHSFIMMLPKRYDTVLTQDGEGISQGQKQLLSIARAILANPALLLLDEATSSIDTVTEVKIQEALQRLMEGRTSFVIAHRLNTIQKADQIIVLEGGRITEKGSHHELLKRQGFYHNLYFGQLRDGAM